jgi:hypothetical protein
MCRKCGTALIISDESGRSFTGYSPFTAENIIKQPSDSSSIDQKQDSVQKTDSA